MKPVTVPEGLLRLLYGKDKIFTAPELEGPPRQENQQQEVSSEEESPSETQPLFKEVSIDPTIVTYTPSSPRVNGHEESDASDSERPPVEEIIVHTEMPDSDEVRYNYFVVWNTVKIYRVQLYIITVYLQSPRTSFEALNEKCNQGFTLQTIRIDIYLYPFLSFVHGNDWFYCRKRKEDVLVSMGQLTVMRSIPPDFVGGTHLSTRGTNELTGIRVKRQRRRWWEF